MQEFIQAHWGVIVTVTAYIFLALVGTMPAPGDPRPLKVKLYEWLFDFLHLISNKVSEKRNITVAPPPEAPK